MVLPASLVCLTGNLVQYIRVGAEITLCRTSNTILPLYL